MINLIKKILREETEEVLVIPSLSIFPDGIEGLKNFIQKKNIKRWSLDDDLDLSQYKGDLAWLEGLVSVSGYLNLNGTQFKSLGNLQSVGTILWLNEFLSEKYTDEEIKSMVNVGVYIYRR
jgi:hypothetical protein